MIHKIFTVYDQAAKAYLTPFFRAEEGQATRLFKDCVCDPTHAFHKNPADYTLFNIGAYNEATALLEPNKTPIALGNGIEYLDSDMYLSKFDKNTPEALKHETAFSHETSVQPGSQG